MGTLSVTNTFSAGTTIVAADVNQNYTDIETFVNSSPGVVQKDIVDAKGDIIAATAADAVSRLAVGTNTQVLTADSSTSTGLAWTTPTAGTVTTVTGTLPIVSSGGATPAISVVTSNDKLILNNQVFS